MQKFKAGDRVRCVQPTGALTNGKIYEVEDTYFANNNAQLFLRLKDMPDGSYLEFRFELLEPEQLEMKIDLPMSTTPYILSNKAGTIIFGTGGGADNPSGASKNDSAKIDLSLIPKISNIEHAKAFMVGEKKYGRYNYCKGHKASQLIAAAKRHLDAWFEGENHDPIDGQHHLGSVMACCSMILRQQELGTLKDDRYYAPSEAP